MGGKKSEEVFILTVLLPLSPPPPVFCTCQEKLYRYTVQMDFEWTGKNLLTYLFCNSLMKVSAVQ